MGVRNQSSYWAVEYLPECRAVCRVNEFRVELKEHAKNSHGHPEYQRIEMGYRFDHSSPFGQIKQRLHHLGYQE